MQAIIFDIDGTLLKSKGIDGELYKSAIIEVLGPVVIRESWGDYTHVTDDGILEEILLDNKVQPSRTIADNVQTVFIYGFAAEFSGEFEFQWQHPEKGASHKCLLFLAQESSNRNDDLARSECAKFGFKDITIDRGNPQRVEVLNTEQFWGFSAFYEGALNESSAIFVLTIN